MASRRSRSRRKRPERRSECRNGPRPCPWVSCRYHLYLDVNLATGSIRYNYPGKEIWELEHTCALDIAERGGCSLEELGSVMNLTGERIRQLSNVTLSRMRRELDPDDSDDTPVGGPLPPA